MVLKIGSTTVVNNTPKIDWAQVTYTANTFVVNIDRIGSVGNGSSAYYGDYRYWYMLNGVLTIGSYY